MKTNLRKLYKQSIKELKTKLKENNELTSTEWNEYANNNNLLSAITIMSRNDFETWNDLKKNV